MAENDLPAMPDDVKNNNTQLMLGNRKGVVFPINWPTVGCNYTYAQCVSGAQSLADLYHTWSRGRVTMVNPDGTGTRYYVYTPDDCAVPYAKISSNESAAHQYLIEQYSIPDSTIKWFIQSGNSTANAGGTTCDTMSAQTFTITHEMGHLVQACSRLFIDIQLLTELSRKTYRYGDRTSNYGQRSGQADLTCQVSTGSNG